VNILGGSHSYHIYKVELSLRRVLCTPASAVKGRCALNFVQLSAWGSAMLMSPNKDETAVHGCHCLGDVAVRMRKVLAMPQSCVV